MKPRIVLAYSGDLDTTVAIPWLAEKNGADVVTVTMDLGQAKELEEVRERALAAGAIRAHVVDAREEFAREHILPVLQAGATYEPRFPIVASLTHPLIAKKLVEIAAIENAAGVAHGSSGRCTGATPIDIAVRTLNPSMRAIAFVRMWNMTAAEALEYARRRNVPLPATPASACSADENLWGRAIACSVLEGRRTQPPEEIYTRTRSVSSAPAMPAYVEIAFQKGVPTAVNGIAMPFVELIESLSTIAGDHAVGRIDVAESARPGIISPVICEAPAAAVLHAAHDALEMLVTPEDLMRVKRHLARTYADLVHRGLWFTPTRDALDAFNAKVQERVTGVVRVKLSKGMCEVAERSSPHVPDQTSTTNSAGEPILA